MKNYRYDGDFGIEVIDENEVTWIKGNTYVLDENNKKVKQLLAQKKLVELQSNPPKTAKKKVEGNK